MHHKTKAVGKALPAIALVTVTLFIFGALEMWFANQTEFWFSISDILLPCVATALLAGLVLTGAVWGLDRLSHGKVTPVLISLLFSFGVAAYLQGSFLTINYGLLDGKTIDWSQYTTYGVIDTLVWALCFAVPLVLLRVRRKWFDLAVKWAPVYILAIQAVTLGTLFLTHDVTKEESAIFTTEHEFELSKDKNVVVFIVDTMDAQYVNEMLEEFPEVYEEFSDFTYFDNASCAYPTTMGALPHLLSGIPYLNEEPWHDYLPHAYKESEIIQTIKESNYAMDVYTGSSFAAPIQDLSTNLAIVRTGINDLSGFFKSYYQLIGFRYAPHYAKRLFWLYGGDLNKYMSATNNLTPYSSGNLQFYEDLMREGLTADRDEPVYKIYHLDGTHPPISMTEELEIVETRETSVAKHTKGCFKIIGEYLEQMKAQGLYDSASIVIMADHGAQYYRNCPAIMIKEANVRGGGQMLVNSAPVSYLTDWKDTILSLITGKERDQSMMNIGENEERERTYYFYSHNIKYDPTYFPDIYEFRFTGRANEIDSDECFTGRVYTKPHERKPYRYHLGDTIQSDDEEFVLNAVQYGIRPYFVGLSSVEKDAAFEVYLDELPENDVQLTMGLCTEMYNTPNFEQTVEVFVNGNSVGKTYILMDDHVNITIPKQLIDDEHMTIELKAETDAHYDGHMENISLIISTIQMNEIDANAMTEELPLLDEDLTIQIKEGFSEERLRMRGVWPTEKEGRWCWKRSQYAFNANAGSDMLFKLKYSSHFDGLEVIVSFNGHEIDRFNQILGPNTLEAVLPKEYFNEKGNQTVEIYIPQITSPAAIGRNSDGRELGLWMQEISLSFLEADQ